MRTYEIIKSAPYCCVCAIIESIVKRHGYEINQYDIANYIGLVCPKEDLPIIPNEITNIHTSIEAKDWGVHLKSDTLNNLFKHFNIPLKETFFSGNQVNEFTFESILEEVSEEYDVMFFISHGTLYGIKDNIDFGHCILYIQKQKDNIEYLDPGPINLGIQTKDIYDIYLSIKKRANSGCGFSVISKID